MPSTKNHHVIEAFSPNRGDQSLGKGIRLSRQLHRMETVTHDVFG
jgi:hypothetical protein